MRDYARPAAFNFFSQQYLLDEVSLQSGFSTVWMTNMPQIDSHSVFCVLPVAIFTAPDDYRYLVP